MTWLQHDHDHIWNIVLRTFFLWPMDVCCCRAFCPGSNKLVSQWCPVCPQVLHESWVCQQYRRLMSLWKYCNGQYQILVVKFLECEIVFGQSVNLLQHKIWFRVLSWWVFHWVFQQIWQLICHGSIWSRKFFAYTLMAGNCQSPQGATDNPCGSYSTTNTLIFSPFPMLCLHVAEQRTALRSHTINNFLHMR